MRNFGSGLMCSQGTFIAYFLISFSRIPRHRRLLYWVCRCWYCHHRQGRGGNFLYPLTGAYTPPTQRRTETPRPCIIFIVQTKASHMRTCVPNGFRLATTRRNPTFEFIGESNIDRELVEIHVGGILILCRFDVQYRRVT